MIFEMVYKLFGGAEFEKYDYQGNNVNNVGYEKLAEREKQIDFLTKVAKAQKLGTIGKKVVTDPALKSFLLENGFTPTKELYINKAILASKGMDPEQIIELFGEDE
jgi:hypothetical protein